MADMFDVRKYIQFKTRITAAHFQENSNTWELIAESGEKFHTRFMITAIGPLSVPTLPRFPGIHDFKGSWCHTGQWPKEGIDYAGKRVAVIGTGATGVQTIQEIAKTAGSLTVFQRRPNWCCPLHNKKIPLDEMEEIRKNYPDIFKRCSETYACFIHTADPRSVFDVTPEEREEFWEKLYASPGFGIWMGNYRDLLVDRKANALISEFVAKKIRQRVHDPETAEKLIPKDHGFGTRRLPLETFYYETYNRPNVKLVDLNETPIEKVTATGITTSKQDYEFDVIIYATGFIPITGAFDVMDIRGIGGKSLKEMWSDGPQTYLGLNVPGFPNMLMILGPHTALGNIPHSIQYAVEWLTQLMAYARDNGITYIDATQEAADAWTEHVWNMGKGLLSFEVDSWMTGINTNVPGKQKRIVARYAGSVAAYRERCDQVAADGYREMKLS